MQEDVSREIIGSTSRVLGTKPPKLVRHKCEPSSLSAVRTLEGIQLLFGDCWNNLSATIFVNGGSSLVGAMQIEDAEDPS